MDTLGRFSTSFYKGDNFRTSYILFCTSSPIEKWVSTKKEKKNIPLWSKLPFK